MAYTINGKVYTSHPLMDEIVYSCKTILDGIVLKNEKLANRYETADSLTESDAFLAIMNDAIHLELLPISSQFLVDHGFSLQEAVNIANDLQRLPDYVECTLTRYNSNDARPAEWIPERARYEFVLGGVAGLNKNTPVYLRNGRFEYANGSVCTGNIIALKEKYYIDAKGNILFQDTEDNTKFYNLDGTEFLATPIECKAGIIAEFANDYPRYESNLYYRTLIGMPAADTKNFDVYINPDDYRKQLELDDNNADFNFDIPIHEFNDFQLNTLESLGILQDIIDIYYNNAEDINKPYYKYLTFLGSRKIDLYQARQAKEWDILYMPAVEHIISDRFKEAYKINRDIYYRRTYQQAYSLYSDYYEEIVMILILCQTFTDLVVETPEFYIRRDIFDLRSAQYFLESNSVAFYNDIPLKYQILLIKNLNKLIKYKSTLKNIDDILAIFSMSDTIIYKFYLFKKYLYNKYERELPEEGDSIDGVGWEATDLIKNGNFETGDLSHWNVTTDPEASLTGGYRIYRDPISPYNISPYFLYYNKSTDDYELNLSQLIRDVPIGKYRIRARLSGTNRYSTGMRFYVNGTSIMGSKVTYGKKWVDAVSNEFIVNSTDDILLEYKGRITHRFEGKIDDIILEQYNEIFDCGDEDEIEGLLYPTEIIDFFDEDSTDEYPTQLYLYDFGNEDSDIIDTGEITDAEFDYIEANRIIYDQVGNVYDLEFIKVPLGEGYDDYIKNSLYHQAYDSIVRQDPYWNGEDTHNYIRNLHLQKDFTIEGTKFMGLEFNISFQEYIYQKEYYLSMYMGSDINTNDVKISVPSIKQNSKFTIKNLVTFVYCCNGLYDGEDAQIVDTTSKFIVYKEKEDYKPYTIIDGGHPWDEDTGTEPIIEPEEEFEVPDLEFGDEDDPEFEIIHDQFLQIYDFGYHIVIDYTDKNLEIYEYGDESVHELTPEEEEIEDNEPEPWPFQDMCDFGCDDISMIEDLGNGDISVPVLRSQHTKIYDFTDEDEWVDPDLPVTDFTDYIYDFGAKTAGTVDYIEPVKQASVLDFNDEDENNSGIKTVSSNDLYDFVDENTTGVMTRDYEYDFSEITEDSIDDIDFEVVPEGWYPPYYIQNSDRTVFKLYDYSPMYEAYILVKDYSTFNPDEPWEYDIRDVITEFNYVQYLGHYAIDMNTGEYTRITLENYRDYLDKLVRMRFPWYDTPPEKYTKIFDGHHNMQDQDHDDVKFNYSQATWSKLDGSEVNGDIVLIEDKYKHMIDGGRTVYTLDQTKEAYYDWMRFEYPNRWLPLTGRVYGFNMAANLNDLALDIGERHSVFGWSRGYTLEECGVSEFIIKTKIDNITEMYNIYDTNTRCYYKLIEKMEDATNRDERQVLDYVYYTLFTKPFDQAMYMLKSGELANTYEEILKERDYTLYDYYMSIKSEPDPEVRRELLRNTLNDLVETLSYYISGDNLKYVLSFISTNSTDAILSYMMKIINFFKSWKVYFLDPRNTYMINDKYNHQVFTGDTATEIKISDWHTDTAAARDSVSIDVKYEILEENKIKAYDGSDTSNPHKGAQVLDVGVHYSDENILEEKIFDGNSDETITNYELMECDIPDDKPYYIRDGGRTDARRTFDTVDGGGPGLMDIRGYEIGEQTHEIIEFVGLPKPTDEYYYADIDGNEEWEDEKLEYSLDGGPSSTRSTVTRTAVTTLDDKNRITVYPRISSSSLNGLEMTDDGLYMENDYVDSQYFDVILNAMTQTKDIIIGTVNPLFETISLFTSIEDLEMIVYTDFGKEFENVEFVFDALKDESIEEMVEEKSENSIKGFIDWFNTINPYVNVMEVM